EEAAHLFRGFKIKLVVIKIKAAISFSHFVIIRKFFNSWRTLYFPGIDTKQNIMCIPILLLYIMRIVRRYNRHFIFSGKFHQYLICLYLLGDIMSLKFYITIRSEY